jgi:hypothetical protein
MTAERIKDALSIAGPQSGERSPEDIVKALDDAGLVIVPKADIIKALDAADYMIVPRRLALLVSELLKSSAVTGGEAAAAEIDLYLNASRSTGSPPSPAERGIP